MRQTMQERIAGHGQIAQSGEAQTLADRLTEELAHEIRSGAYPIGARLPTEKVMTQQYGVSRTVIREVISRLKFEGLVETKQGSGTVVLDPAASYSFRLGKPDEDLARGVLRILELRRGIEAEMAALAAERRSAKDLSRLKACLKNIDLAVQRGGNGVEEDLQFHLTIAHATGNPHYPELLGMLTLALKDAIRITRGNEARQTPLAEEVRKEHEAICKAIERKDVEAARAAAFSHMTNTERRIRNVDPEYWQGANRIAAGRLARTIAEAVSLK